MNASFVLGFLSGIIAIIAAIPYLRDVLKGVTTLERGSYTIWLILPFVALVAQFLEGAKGSLGLAIADTLIAVIFFGLCFRYGHKGVEKRDAIALAIAVIAVIASIAAKSPSVALFGAIFADAIAMVLIIIKAYEAPQTETTSSWVLYAVAAIFAIFAVGTFSLTLLVYPVYVMVSAIIVLVAQQIGFRRGHMRGSLQNTPKRSWPIP